MRSTVSAGIAEILGLFLVIIGVGCCVAAASLVSTALAVLVCGVFLLLAGVLVVYVAARLDAPSEPRPRT